ncbi:MAG: exodeoxyribonuclease I [Candidatus Saccharibacteria bacterium]|nr:exodeoxyribonuclease I [Candidatus Saccharibacteria bacterium]
MTFYFYDLETTGLDPIQDRILQFAGQRLDANLEPISDLEEFYVKVSEDILPNPQAITTHKILPQQANLEGLTEYQFLNWLEENVYLKETVFAGYNTIFFDNPFMKWLHWRNFTPTSPILEASANFDLYPLLRLAADIRPQGLQWSRDSETQKLNLTLGVLSEANNIKHSHQHTAGSDIEASINLARLIRQKQPKLFEHFLNLRQADFVKKIINQDKQPFLYSTYTNLGFNKTTSTSLSAVLCEHPIHLDSYIVYDLRYDLKPWQKLSAYDLVLAIKKSRLRKAPPTPFSVLNINQLPAVAPLTVLDKDSAQRLKLDKSVIFANFRALKEDQLAKTIAETYTQLNQDIPQSDNVEVTLAESDLSQSDINKCQEVRQATADQLTNLEISFDDNRFRQLLFLYQARNFPKTLQQNQLLAWEKYKAQSLKKNLKHFKNQLQKSLRQYANDSEKINLLEELQFYIDSILPQSS